MRTTAKLAFAAVVAALAVPAGTLADTATGQDRANAARACSALRASLGETMFKQTYGTAATNRRNAFGRCVSQWTRAEHQARHSAQEECTTEQNDPNFPSTHGGKTFAEFYGTGPKHRNAFGRCVSMKARAISRELRENTVNAARQCRAERRTMGEAAFRERYGRNANDRNAFGKCVSQLAKQQNG